MHYTNYFVHIALPLVKILLRKYFGLIHQTTSLLFDKAINHKRTLEKSSSKQTLEQFYMQACAIEERLN